MAPIVLLEKSIARKGPFPGLWTRESGQALRIFPFRLSDSRTAMKESTMEQPPLPPRTIRKRGSGPPAFRRAAARAAPGAASPAAMPARTPRREAFGVEARWVMVSAPVSIEGRLGR